MEEIEQSYNWSETIFIGDGPITRSKLTRTFEDTRKWFLMKPRPFSKSTDYTLKGAEVDTMNTDRAELCRELANCLSICTYDIVDGLLEESARTRYQAHTVYSRRQLRNSSLASLANNIFAVVYFDWFSTRTNEDIRAINDQLKNHIFCYSIAECEYRYQRSPTTPITPLIYAFCDCYFIFDNHYAGSGDIIGCQMVEKFLRVLEKSLLTGDFQGQETPPTDIMHGTEHVGVAGNTCKSQSKRVTLHKYNERPLSEIFSATPEEIVSFLRNEQPKTHIHDHEIPKSPPVVIDIVRIVTDLLQPLILNSMKTKCRNAKISISKIELVTLSSLASNRFSAHFTRYFFQRANDVHSLKVLMEVQGKLQSECGSQNGSRYSAIVERVRDAARSWDLVELTGNLFAAPEKDRDYSRLMDVIWFELLEGLYRPMEIAFDLCSFAKPCFRNITVDHKEVVLRRTNSPELV